MIRHIVMFKFREMEDLEKYRIHPVHQEVVEFFKTVKDSSASVDYEC